MGLAYPVESPHINCPPMQTRPRHTPIFLILALFGASLVIAACGNSEPELHVIEGEAVEIGEVLHTVQITRFLNPDSVEDRSYLEGAPPEAKGKNYLAVFIKIQNEGSEETTVPLSYKIVDTRGNVYRPLFLDNPFALEFGATIEAEGHVPESDSAAAAGPVKGSMMLFLIDEVASENRPLELIVPGGSDSPEGSVELDL